MTPIAITKAVRIGRKPHLSFSSPSWQKLAPPSGKVSGSPYPVVIFLTTSQKTGKPIPYIEMMERTIWRFWSSNTAMFPKKPAMTITAS